jgi:hypothetical protein
MVDEEFGSQSRKFEYFEQPAQRLLDRNKYVMLPAMALEYKWPLEAKTNSGNKETPAGLRIGRSQLDRDPERGQICGTDILQIYPR